MKLEKKIKLAHLIFAETIGGVERDFSEFISCHYEGVSHYILTKSRFHPYLTKKIVTASKKIYFMRKIYGIKIPKFLLPLRSKYIENKIKTLNPDVWLLWNVLPNFLSYSFVLQYNYIYYEHGEAWRNYFNEKSKEYLDNANSIICVSNAAKRMLELRWGIKNKHIYVCKNALRPDCKPDMVLPKLIFHNKTINLGIAGRHVSYKGFPLVIYALKELKKRKIPCKLYVAGTGKKLEDLKKLVFSLNLEDDVIFLGLVHNMKEFYATIDIFICPSLREPFGLVVVEAMAHGCPVIVTGVDGLYEMVEDTNAGIIIKPTIDFDYYPEFGGSLDLFNEVKYVYDPYMDIIVKPKFINPIHIADAVEELWNRPNKFTEMSTNAIKVVNEKFDYNKHIEALYLIIKKFIES